MMKNFELNTGALMPVLGLGTWKSEDKVVYHAIRSAIEMGYRQIDCAYVYANQGVVGKAIEDALLNGDVNREELFITSKLWNDSHVKNDVEPALESTLKDLKLDYIDLYLIHWPVAFKKGVDMPQNEDDFVSLDDIPLSETWEQMEKLVNKGLIKNIGVSNYSIKKLEQMKQYANIVPAVNQVEIHPYLQQDKMLEYANNNGITLTAYSPLGWGRQLPPSVGPYPIEHPVILEIAQKHNATAAQVLLKWNIQRGIVVIPKSANPERIKENLGCLNIKLDTSDMEKIAKLNKNFRFVDGTVFVSENKGYTLETIWD